MEFDPPRILLAGVNSGCGKTTVTCAVLQALVDRRLNVGAFKCGPDYIDPMFHSRIIGAKSANLDLFFFSPNTLRYLLAKNASGMDISVIEGVMGFYDGVSLTSPQASSWDIACATGTPVVLVVPAKGAALSVLAVIQGFLDFQSGSRICGVILNRCTAMSYRGLAEAIRERFGDKILPLGFLPEMPECAIESRHLGLVTASEIDGLREKLHRLAKQAEASIDLDKLIQLAGSAPPLDFEPVTVPKYDPVRIGVARDRAFCFYYEDSLEILKEMGAELVEFSPLSDSALPEKLDGLYFGGGYPELYAQELSENSSMRKSVRRALGSGMPCIAECGGFMYLTQDINGFEMAGFLPGKCWDNHKLTRFGYVSLCAKADNLLCKAGDVIRGHEFHYWDTSEPGADFSAVKLSGKSWDCVFANRHIYAGYPHFHFYANPRFAGNFYRSCMKVCRKENG